MTMQVGKIDLINFRGSLPQVNSTKSNDTYNTTIQKLGYVTPDFQVKTPQTYKKIGQNKLLNGLEIHTYKLANGHKITIVPMKNSPAVVKNYVNVGSMNETEDIKGISHFLEHMAFNGSTGDNGYIKLNTGDSFKKIEARGGWINASTGYAITDYVNSTPQLENSDLEEQIKVMAAMTENLELAKNMITKEKGPVSSEINMIMDDTQTIAIDQTMRTLFNIKSSADELIGGSVKHIQKLNREKVKQYYETYYTPDNMNLVITGDVNPDEAIQLVSKHFKSTKTSKRIKHETTLTPIEKSIRKDFISDKTKISNAVIGFVGPQNNDVKSAVIENIVTEYLNSPEVGITSKLKELNVTGGYLCNEKISSNKSAPTALYINLNGTNNNIEKALKVFYDKISDIKKIDNKNLENIKERLLSNQKDTLEYSDIVNTMVGYTTLNGTTEYITNYEQILNDITPNDIDNFIKKYININKAAISVVHPEEDKNNIINNHKEASKLSFKGTSNRLPMEVDKNSIITLSNNFNLGTVETKNDNISFTISLTHNNNEKQNPALTEILNELLNMGTENKDEKDFEKYTSDNNINTMVGIDNQKINLYGHSTLKNFDKTFDLTKEMLYNPRFTQKDFETAKERIKDRLNKRQNSSKSLYAEYESKYDTKYKSKQDILNNIDNVSLEDIKHFYKNSLENSMGNISINLPENVKDSFYSRIKAKFNTLNCVKPYKRNELNTFVENKKPIVLTAEESFSQADISQTYKYKRDNSIKGEITEKLLNSILSNSSTIGLFNTLREKEHLAYSVRSNIRTSGDKGELSCNILTTTDNKEIGEISYENLQKSIDGFHRQINCLMNSEFSDQDLETAKRTLKANLLDQQGLDTKIDNLADCMDYDCDKERLNNKFKTIDSITREDINNLAKHIFANAPIYSIVASKDTLDANKNYLNTLEN